MPPLSTTAFLLTRKVHDQIKNIFFVTNTTRAEVITYKGLCIGRVEELGFLQVVESSNSLFTGVNGNKESKKKY